MLQLFRGVLVAVTALTLVACDSDDRPSVPFQVVHAVADAPNVEVTNRGKTIAADLAFKQSTGITYLRAGSAQIRVNARLPGGPATVIGPANVPLLEGNSYTVLAVGAVGSMSTPIQPLVLQNPSTPVGSGNARVQIVHAAASAPPVDIHVTAPGDAIFPSSAIAGGNTAFGASSPRIEVPAGDYRVRVTLPGATDALFDSGTISLPGGADLVVVAVDNTVAGRSAPSAAPITLLVADGTGQFEILDQATPAEVRVVHAVPDANGVDVYVNDPTAAATPAIAGLDYAEVVPADADSYLALAPGTTNLLVTGASNRGFIAIPATDVELEPGRQYTVYASGTLGAGIEPYITADDDRSVVTEARARIIHLAPSAGPVDIYVTAPMADITNLSPTFPGVDFRNETGYVSLAGGSYTVAVTLAGTKTVAIGPATITLVEGGVYTAVARDPDVDVGNDPFGLILLDDF